MLVARNEDKSGDGAAQRESRRSEQASIFHFPIIPDNPGSSQFHTGFMTLKK
jgi:hypothetical protein